MKKLHSPVSLAIVLGVVVASFSSRTEAQVRQITMTQFDSWIFQGSGNEQAARQSLASKVQLEISRIEQFAEFSDAQKDTIRLASKGDVKRFFDRVERARDEFRALGEVAQNQINEAYQLAMPLQQELTAGIFGDQSLVHKVIMASLNDEQSEKMELQEQRRQRQRLKTATKLWIAGLGRKMPLTIKQRTQLLELAETIVTSVPNNPRYIPYLVAYRFDQVPKDQLREFFDDAQWKVVEQTLRNAKRFEGILKNAGMLADDE